MALGMAEDAGAMLHPAGFRIGCAIIDATDPGGGDGGSTNRAGLKRHVKVKPGQAFVLKCCAGRADHETFRMSSRVVLLPHPVAVTRQHVSRWYKDLLNELHALQDWSTEAVQREFQMQLFPDNELAWGLQATAYAHCGQLEKAVPYFARSYENDPEDGWRMYTLGSALLASHNLDGLRAWTGKFVSRFQETDNAATASNLCKILLIGQIEPADKTLIKRLVNRSVKQQPKDLWTRVVQALFEFRAGEFGRCEQTCGSILEQSFDDRQKALAHSIRGLARKGRNHSDWQHDIQAAKSLHNSLRKNVFTWYDNAHIALLIDEAERSGSPSPAPSADELPASDKSADVNPASRGGDSENPAGSASTAKETDPSDK